MDRSCPGWVCASILEMKGAGGAGCYQKEKERKKSRSVVRSNESHEVDHIPLVIIPSLPSNRRWSG
jgi:hypothetical protein